MPKSADDLSYLDTSSSKSDFYGLADEAKLLEQVANAKP